MRRLPAPEPPTVAGQAGDLAADRAATGQAADLVADRVAAGPEEDLVEVRAADLAGEPAVDRVDPAADLAGGPVAIKVDREVPAEVDSGGAETEAIEGSSRIQQVQLPQPQLE
jgi:hypothetical protein